MKHTRGWPHAPSKQMVHDALEADRRAFDHMLRPRTFRKPGIARAMAEALRKRRTG